MPPVRQPLVNGGKWKCVRSSSSARYGDSWDSDESAKAVAERLIPFGPRMIYFDPLRIEDAEEKRYQVTFAGLEDVLRSADVLSLHCPLTDETKGLISRNKITLMKQGAVVINVARGEIIDEPALAEALRGGKLGGAALDVFSAEPIDRANPLLATAADNVILSPHVAGVSQEAQGRIITMTISNIVKVMQGQVPESLVN